MNDRLEHIEDAEETLEEGKVQETYKWKDIWNTKFLEHDRNLLAVFHKLRVINIYRLEIRSVNFMVSCYDSFPTACFSDQ